MQQPLSRLVKLCVSLIFWLADSSIKPILRILGKKFQGTCVVLYYHVVEHEKRKRFARQMDCLLKFAQPISLDREHVLKAATRYAAVTFDDGFHASIENAVPELVKRNIPVTIFIPSGCIGLFTPWLKGEPGPDHGGFVMTAEQIRRIGRNELVSIGSHCISHFNLLFLNEEEAKKEIFDSKLELEIILGKNIKTLSFPHGAFNQQHVEWARAAGYERTFSILPNLAFCRPDEYVTGRVRVDPTDWRLEFRLKLLGTYRWLPLVFTLKAQMRSMLNNYLRYIRPTIGSKRTVIACSEEARSNAAKKRI